MRYLNLPFFLSVLMLTLLLLASCQQDQFHQPISLDKTLKNSFSVADFPFLEENPEQMQHGDFETIIFEDTATTVSIRAADVNLGKTRFRIGIIDANHDGKFNTINEDRLVISTYGVDTIPLAFRMPSAGRLRSKNIFKVDRSYFMITEIDEAGKNIELIPWTRCTDDLLVAQRKTCLGKIPLKNLDGEELFVGTTSPDNKPMLVLTINNEVVDGAFFRALNNQIETWQNSANIMVVYLPVMSDETKNMLASQQLPFAVYLRGRETCYFLNCHSTKMLGMLVDHHGRLLRIGLRQDAVIDLLGIDFEVPVNIR